MTARNPDGLTDNRRDDLLCDLTLQGLSAAERAELTSLAPDDHDELALTLELVAAAVQVGLSPPVEVPPLPGDLSARLRSDAESFFAAARLTQTPETMQIPALSPGRPTSPTRQPYRRTYLLTWGGWLAAAAASLALALVWPREARPPGPVNDPKPGAAETPALAQMLTMAASYPSTTFAATAHPLAGSARGKLVWDGDHQRGFLSIEGLAAADPRKGVYQLWIFDKKRDQRYPVDGGVFTIQSPSGTTVVPVRPALPVSEPSLFAITLEPPGGVVVSDRQRILLTANWNDR